MVEAKALSIALILEKLCAVSGFVRLAFALPRRPLA